MPPTHPAQPGAAAAPVPRRRAEPLATDEPTFHEDAVGAAVTTTAVTATRPPPPALCIHDADTHTPHPHTHTQAGAASHVASASAASSARRPPPVPAPVLPSTRASGPGGMAVSWAASSSSSTSSSPAGAARAPALSHSHPSSPVSMQLHAAAPSPFAAARGAALQAQQQAQRSMTPRLPLPLRQLAAASHSSAGEREGCASETTVTATAADEEQGTAAACAGGDSAHAAAGTAAATVSAAPIRPAAAVLEELQQLSLAASPGPLSCRLKSSGVASHSLPPPDPLAAHGVYSNHASLVPSGAPHHIRFCHSRHATPQLAWRDLYFATDGSVPVLYHDIRMVSPDRLVLPVVLCAYTETAAEIRATLLALAAMQHDMQSAGWPVDLHVALVMDGWFRAPHSTKQYVRKLFQTPRQQTMAAAAAMAALPTGDSGSGSGRLLQFEDILSEWCSDSESRPPSGVHTLIVQKVSSSPVCMSTPLPGTADPEALVAILPVDVTDGSGAEANDSAKHAAKRRLKLTLIIKRDNRRKHNSHDWFLRSFAPRYATSDAEHGHKLAFMTDSGTKFDPRCLRKLVEYMHSHPSCSAASGYQRAMPEWMQQYETTTKPSLAARLWSFLRPPSLSLSSLRGSLYRHAQQFEYESSMNAFSSAFHFSGQLQVLPGPCQLIRLDLIVRETPANVRMRLVAERNQHWRAELKALHHKQTGVLRAAFQQIHTQMGRMQSDRAFAQYLDSTLELHTESSCGGGDGGGLSRLLSDRSRFHTQLLSLEHTVDKQLELLQLLYLDLPHPHEFELDQALASDEQAAYFVELFKQLERECEMLRVDLDACSSAAMRLERVVAAMDARAAQPLLMQRSMRADVEHAVFDACMESLHRVLVRESTRLLRWLERFDPTRHAQMSAPIDLLAHAICVQSLDSDRREEHEEQRFRALLRRARDPADYYFICMARSPEDAGLLLGNLQLAEDRVFSYACVLHVRQHVHTAFVPNALFYFPVETEAESSIQQIRRWSNGTVAGFLFLFQYRDTFLKRLGWAAWRPARSIESAEERGSEQSGARATNAGAAPVLPLDAIEQPYSTRAFDRERRSIVDLLDSSLRSVSVGAPVTSPNSLHSLTSPRQRRMAHGEGDPQHKTASAVTVGQPQSPSWNPPALQPPSQPHAPAQQSDMSLVFYRKDRADADRLHSHSSVSTGLMQQLQLSFFLLLTGLQLCMSVCVAVSPSVWFLALYFSLPAVLPSDGLYDQWVVLAYIVLYALFVHLHAHPARVRLHTSLFHVLTLINMLVAVVPAYAAISYFTQTCADSMNPLQETTTDCRWIAVTVVCVIGAPFLLALLHDLYILLPTLERVPLTAKQQQQQQQPIGESVGSISSSGSVSASRRLLPPLSVRVRWEWPGTPSVVTMLCSLLPFYLYLPTRGSYLTSYAYSRVWELTWGSKPSDPATATGAAHANGRNSPAVQAARLLSMQQSALVLAYSLLALNIGIFLVGCQLSEYRGVLSGFAVLLLSAIVVQMAVSAVWLVYKLSVAPVLRVLTEIGRFAGGACKRNKQMYKSVTDTASNGHSARSRGDHNDHNNDDNTLTTAAAASTAAPTATTDERDMVEMV